MPGKLKLQLPLTFSDFQLLKWLNVDSGYGSVVESSALHTWGPGFNLQGYKHPPQAKSKCCTPHTHTTQNQILGHLPHPASLHLLGFLFLKWSQSCMGWLTPVNLASSWEQGRLCWVQMSITSRHRLSQTKQKNYLKNESAITTTQLKILAAHQQRFRFRGVTVLASYPSASALWL